MEDLNNVPSSGTYGAAINEVNANFSLVVNAINSLEYATTKSKGIYNNGFTPSTTTLPNSVNGDWCMVLGTGNTFPARIWTFNGTTWAQGGTWNPDGINLNDYATTTALNTAVANSLLQATARMGYGEATASNNAYSVTITNYTLPTNGGVVRVKMPTAATGAATLNITNTGAKTLWYNGKAVSSTNTWEEGEIISVFYDGTKYMSSNSQGGGGDADKIKYNNSQSGLAADNLQEALDEVCDNIDELGDNIYEYETIDWISLTTTLKYYINGGNGVWVKDNNSTTQRMCRIVPISHNSKYRITAKDDHPISFALLNNNNPASHVGEVATDWNGGLPMVIDAGGVITIDSGEYTYLYIRNDYASASTNIKYPKSIEKRGSIRGSEVRTIYPLFTYDYIGGTTGEFTNETTRFENGKNWATPRFIKTSSAFKAKANAVGSFQVYYYDSEFNFLQVIVTQYPTADVELELTPTVSHSYVKIVFQRENSFIKANISLTGIFEDNWDVFNVRPSNGFHRIGIMVNVSDAQCSDATTSTVQDEIDLRPNYGVIALPTTYSNTGKPTRLIIYCHGAGTHFTFNNSTRFDTSKHVDPTYWLKEGYAVMDIDGNPMDAEAHAFRPQAMNAYIAGYKWAIEHYNLYRDGVLLGGRSMGGGTTMYLLRGTCPIPVIAACANHPTSVALGAIIPSQTTAAQKLNVAVIRGYIIPNGFTFSNGVMNDDDTQVYYDNWEKGLRYTPSMALCVDTPTTEEWRKNFIKNCCHVGNPYEANRIAACKDLHMIIRAPLKMFGCFEDPNNGWQATAQLYMTMLGNAGQQAEYRLYHSDKTTNYPSDSRSAHYYELADPTLRTTVTTVYGEEVTNVPMVYIEMLQFWRRYEQNM